MDITASADKFMLQFAAVCLYLLSMGIMFCDGFKMRMDRKLIWFTSFLVIAVYSLKTRGYFDLAVILPVPSLLAIVLARYELAARITGEGSKKNIPDE